MFVTAVYLLDIVDAACTLGTHGGNQQGDTCTDIWARHTTSTQGDFPIVTHDHSTVRIAEDNLCTHVNEFIDEEQTALKHLLMEEHAATSLSGYHDEH